MISKDFDVIILDLHNTIYDEVMEYGMAMDEAISYLEHESKINKEILYTELSIAHKELGSDWDDNVWKILPSLKNVPTDTISKTISLRRAFSKALTIQGIYKGAIETLKNLQASGKRIYLVTEAAADAGMQAVKWLGLEGVVSGVYTYPSRKKPVELKGTFNKFFGSKNGKHFVKPNPLLIAQVAFDDAIRQKIISADIRFEEIFTIKHNDGLALPELEKNLPIQNDITAQLIIHNNEMKNVFKKILFVGDSKFKDGVMARNACVKFAYAAYGKNIDNGMEANFEKCKTILYAVTGWDKDILKLTQEAGKSDIINKLKPDFILGSFADL